LSVQDNFPISPFIISNISLYSLSNFVCFTFICSSSPQITHILFSNFSVSIAIFLNSANLLSNPLNNSSFVIIFLFGLSFSLFFNSVVQLSFIFNISPKVLSQSLVCFFNKEIYFCKSLSVIHPFLNISVNLNDLTVISLTSFGIFIFKNSVFS
jgi:hypothetical protein